MKTFLLTDGEFTGLIRTLRCLNEETRIIGFVPSSLSAHITMLDKFYVAPEWRSKEYLPFLIDVINQENIDFVFPVITTSLDYMAEVKDYIFEKTGAVVIISSPESIRSANNKALLFDAVSKTDFNEIITPYKRVSTVGELRKAYQEFSDSGVECISKPVCGENAEGFLHFVSKEAYAEAVLKGEASKLVSIESLDALDDSAILPEDRLVMPFLPGKEWDVDVLSWKGEIPAATVRMNMDMFGGLSACTRTMDNPILLEYCRKIVRTLGLDYLACISFKEDADGNPKLLEINPRSMGSIHLSTLSGNNLVQQLFDLTDICGNSCILPGNTKLTSPGITASLYYDIVEVNPKPVIWNRISPPDYQTYEKYYSLTGSRITDIVFNCRFAWDSLYHFKWAVIEDCFVQISFGGEYSSPFMLMPLGKFDTEKLDRIVGIVKKEFDVRGLDFTIYGIDEKYVPLFEDMKVPHGRVYYNDDFSDYLYEGEKLRTLAGRNFSKKRNHLKKFESRYPNAEYASLAPEYFSECLDLVRKWSSEKGVDISNMGESDYYMIENMFKNWTRLNCRGGVIKIDGKIAAFSIGSLEGGTAYIHFEKADVNYDGLYVAINKYVLENEFPTAALVNREEDLGIKGLRQAKQSYFPCAMVKKYKMDIG